MNDKSWKYRDSQIFAFFKTIYSFFCLFFKHFKTIRKDPGKFVLWFLTSVVLSLSPVWLPSILGSLIGKDLFAMLLPNNPFIVYSIVFLSSSVLTSINYIGAGTTNFAVALRGITLVVTIMFLILLSSVVPLKLIGNISLEPNVQYTLLAITILLGIYVYGFRDPDWEKGLDESRKRQDDEIKAIADKATLIQATESGIAL